MPDAKFSHIEPHRSAWDKFKSKAGILPEPEHEPKVMPNSGHPREEDHLYHMIDAPGRLSKPTPLFGMAKSFPQVTRTGYKKYLADQLSDKDEEDKMSSESHPSSPKSKKSDRDSHEHQQHIFRITDFGFMYTFKQKYQAELAEFLGMTVFMLVGLAVSTQNVLSKSEEDNYTTVAFGWGFALMLGIYTAGGYSGAHLNPVLTFNLWLFRGFPFRRMFFFWVAQLLGSIVGAAWCFLLYFPALRNVDPDGYTLRLSSVFLTWPEEGIPLVSCWFSEVTATALMHLAVFAIGDAHNISPVRGMNALVLAFFVTMLACSFGFFSPFGLNPFRDFGPRIFLSMVGFPKDIWYANKLWWLVGLITGPSLGGFIGCLLYDTFIFSGPESPINFPWSVLAKASHISLQQLLHPLTNLRFKWDPVKLEHEKLYPNYQHDVDLDYSNDREHGKISIQGQPAG